MATSPSSGFIDISHEFVDTSYSVDDSPSHGESQYQLPDVDEYVDGPFPINTIPKTKSKLKKSLDLYSTNSIPSSNTSTHKMGITMPATKDATIGQDPLYPDDHMSVLIKHAVDSHCTGEKLANSRSAFTNNDTNKFNSSDPIHLRDQKSNPNFDHTNNRKSLPNQLDRTVEGDTSKHQETNCIDKPLPVGDVIINSESQKVLDSGAQEIIIDSQSQELLPSSDQTSIKSLHCELSLSDTGVPPNMPPIPLFDIPTKSHPFIIDSDEDVNESLDIKHEHTSSQNKHKLVTNKSSPSLHDGSPIIELAGLPQTAQPQEFKDDDSDLEIIEISSTLSSNIMKQKKYPESRIKQDSDDDIEITGFHDNYIDLSSDSFTSAKVQSGHESNGCDITEIQHSNIGSCDEKDLDLEKSANSSHKNKNGPYTTTKTKVKKESIPDSGLETPPEDATEGPNSKNKRRASNDSHETSNTKRIKTEDSSSDEEKANESFEEGRLYGTNVNPDLNSNYTDPNVISSHIRLAYSPLLGSADNYDTLSLLDVLNQRNMRHMWQFNFSIDLLYLLSNISPATRPLLKTHVVVGSLPKKPFYVPYENHAQDVPKYLETVASNLRAKGKDNVNIVKIKLPSYFGTPHTKLMVLAFEDKYNDKKIRGTTGKYKNVTDIQIIIHTANLTELDWE